MTCMDQWKLSTRKVKHGNDEHEKNQHGKVKHEKKENFINTIYYFIKNFTFFYDKKKQRILM